jgi:hypothetical protein
MMGKNALILVVGFAIITGVIRLSLQRGNRDISQIAYDRFEDNNARNAAHSGAQLALDKLRGSPAWRDGFSNLDIFAATVDVQVYDQTSDSTLGQDTLRIEAQGDMGGDSAEVIMTVTMDLADFLGNINSAITGNSNINTLGDMIVDGRDHDLNGNVIANNGTYAIITTENYIQGGNTFLGGTPLTGIDIAPTRTGWEPIVLDNYVWPGGYPTTPEEVLGGEPAGLPPDFFKMVAMSGYNGSQYTTDPDALSFPLSGVTYVELPIGVQWNPADLGTTGRGILIVHNDDRSALIQNLNCTLFRGLIIVDDLMHVHTDVIGAIFVLTENPMAGNCIGNGTGDVMFSRIALDEALGGIGINLASLSILDYWE